MQEEVTGLDPGTKYAFRCASALLTRPAMGAQCDALCWAAAERTSAREAEHALNPPPCALHVPRKQGSPRQA